ncbi:hypothetical protein [Moraxella oblonga]|uniref:hypothetical protein n=1 Tax=Moraxella oblonga TaxID=200413 RepID=UPI0008349553|nr:hypothetical protein [Moraxella oblonga]
MNADTPQSTTKPTSEHPKELPPNETMTGVFSRSALNVLLVFLESAITLVLRFDPKLRELAYPLANQDKIVCIRTYLPHTQIYATFGYRGVLLDDRLPPNRTADITINAYTFQLFNLLTNHNPKSVDGLQIRGETDDVAQLKAFLVQLGIGGVIDNLLGKVKKDKPTAEEREKKAERTKAKIAKLEEQVATLANENAHLTTALAETASKQKSTKMALIVMSVVALIAVMSHFFI